MNILVACEESQTICLAFRSIGHNAFSCDLVPCSGGHPEYHIIADALSLVNGNCSFYTVSGDFYRLIGQWDLLIAHPPCTYLSNAGARWLYPHGELDFERAALGFKAKEFFMSFYNAACNYICIENPIPSKLFELPPFSQKIQPYEFGHPFSKTTLLWLKGLPELIPTNIVFDFIPYVSSGSYSKYKDKRYSGIGRSSKVRSKTFSGVAEAMALQWGDLPSSSLLLSCELSDSELIFDGRRWD